MNIKVELEKHAIEEMKADLASWRTRLKENVFNALTVLEAAVLANIRSNAGLNVMTGKLLNSIGRSKKVREEGNGVIVGELGPKGVPYAAIHEFGGTIVPTKAQALTIPLPDNKRRDGKPKITAREAFASGRAFINDGIIFQRKFSKKGGGKEELLPLFVLKKSVTIPARPYLSTAINSTQDAIIKNFGLFLTASFSKKG